MSDKELIGLFIGGLIGISVAKLERNSTPKTHALISFTSGAIIGASLVNFTMEPEK